MTKENQDLEIQLSKYKCEREKTKHRLSTLENRSKELEQELDSKECQITSYYNALEKNKEEMIELNMEIENLRYAETNPNKKGNSLFSEVEDNRKHVEKQYLSLKSKYDIISKQFDLKDQQIGKLKLQIASLLSLNSNKVDKGFIVTLEKSLESSRQQVAEFKQHCAQLKEELSEKEKILADQAALLASTSGKNTMSNFFQKRAEEFRKKIKELEEKNNNMLFNKVVLNDKIMQLESKLRESDVAREQTFAENIRLKVKIDDLLTKKGVKPGMLL